MPAPGIPNQWIVTAEERAAYRKTQAGLQKPDPKHPYVDSQLGRLLAEMNLMTAGAPWSIDEFGCLSRTIGTPESS